MTDATPTDPPLREFLTAAQAAADYAGMSHQAAKQVLTIAQGMQVDPLPDPGTHSAVIIGSSNALPGGWAGQVCVELGLVERSFAVGGAAFHGGGFLAQLTAARDSSAFDNAGVAVVFIADCSNDTRMSNDAGVRIDTVYANSGVVLSNARAWFPNARVIVLPIIWPADPAKQATTVPGGYQVIWNHWVHFNADALRRRALEFGCEFIEDTWTWLTGHDEWMEGAGASGVHPNAAGHVQIGRWVSKYLRGEPTTSRTSWVGMDPLHPANYETRDTGSARPISVCRDGWDVTIDGAVITKVEIGASLTVSDWLRVPPGFRPTYAVEVQVRINNSVTRYPGLVFPDGTLRVLHNVNIPASTYVLISGRYMVG